FLGLAQSATITMESGPHPAAKLLDDAGRDEPNPDLIRVHITPFGFRDERRRRGNDLIAAAAGGLMQISGRPHGPPVQAGGDQAYKMAGLLAATGALIALTALELGRGGGAQIDISLQTAVMATTIQTSNPN